MRKALRAARVARKMTQQAVADVIAADLGCGSLTRQTVHQWEAFATHPDLITLASWARAVGLRLAVSLETP